MKKITFLFLVFLAFNFTATAQFTFPTVAGPTNVVAGTSSTLNINDAANTANATADTYGIFIITVDWTSGGGGAWSIEADLTVTTAAGSVLVDPPSTGGAINDDSTTLTFEGVFTAPYDPSVDGMLNLELNQAFAGTSADWLNIIVEVLPLPTGTNDNFADATPISCGDTNITGNTSFASLDEDDAPDGFGADMDAPNVWYSYDSVVEGAADVTVNLCPSSYDTSILVYTGTSGNLTLIAGNDDNASACGGGSTRSELTFTANGTDVYFIAIEGFDFVSTGMFDMSISCVTSCTPAQANQDCASAIGLAVNDSTTTIDNFCATLNAATVTCEVFNPIADVWYSFDATATGIVGIQTTLNGTATQANITAYSGACGALIEIGCQDENAAGELLNLTGLNPGETYYLQLWNSGGSEEGTFDVTLSEMLLSVADFDNENAFTYYPNPVKNSLTLKAVNEIQNVSIYNMLGQEVLRTALNAIEKDIDMSSLQTGTYFVQVTINDVTETVRILKQ